jgi:hypothetical protein
MSETRNDPLENPPGTDVKPWQSVGRKSAAPSASVAGNRRITLRSSALPVIACEVERIQSRRAEEA